MFDKLKDVYNLQKQAREMQALLAQEKVEGVSRDGNFRVEMNGNQDIVSVSVSETAELTKESVERNAKEAFSDVLTKVKNLMADKLKGMM